MGTFGEIASSTIMRDPSGRSRGFAFLTFANVSSVEKVMTQVHHLDGKQVHILDHSPVSIRQLTIRSTPSELFLETRMKRLQRSLSVV
jgi:RNA recognition motif-containing protein